MRLDKARPQQVSLVVPLLHRLRLRLVEAYFLRNSSRGSSSRACLEAANPPWEVGYLVVPPVPEADSNCNNQRSKRVLCLAVLAALEEAGYFRSKDKDNNKDINSKDCRSLDSSNSLIKFLLPHTALNYLFPMPRRSFLHLQQSLASLFSAMRAFPAIFRDRSCMA